MNNQRLRWKLAAAGMLVALCAASAEGESVSLAPDLDNTLYERVSGDRSNGIGEQFVSGRAGGGGVNNGAIRRGLLRFDIAAAIPAGAQIDSVTLTLQLVDSSDASNRSYGLHTVLTNWGEGTSNAGTGSGSGSGALSQTGDATWLHTFYNTSTWTTPGGDFDSTASASEVIGSTLGSYTWDSTAALVGDVQGWLDNPTTNFGWILISDESVLDTNRRFGSREHSNELFRPILNVTYSIVAVPEPENVLLALINFVFLFVFQNRRRHSSIRWA